MMLSLRAHDVEDLDARDLGLTLATTSFGVSASISISFDSVTRTLWTTRSGVSACQLMVTGVVPTMTRPGGRRGRGVLPEKVGVTASCDHAGALDHGRRLARGSGAHR